MSTESGEREQPNTSSGTTKPRPPIWRRAGVWIGGVAAAALTTLAVGAITPGLGWFEAAVNTRGAPVEVRVAVEDRPEDVALAPEAELSTNELAQLAAMQVEEQVGWLEEHEDGAVSGTQTVTLYLTGNRTGTVRITDLKAVETCEPISRGTLVRMVTGRGAGVDSEIVNVDVGEGPGDAYVYDENFERAEYFPERTITLARDEEVALVVDLIPDFNGSTCEVELEMTVRDGDAEQRQRISGPDGPFVVTSIELDEAEGEYGAVYLGGAICREYVPATPGWSNFPPCGEGNDAER
jgi:hypothetical protein